MKRIATITLNDLAKMQEMGFSPKDAHDAIIAEAERRTGRVCVMFNDPGQNLWYVMATPLRLECNAGRNPSQTGVGASANTTPLRVSGN